MYYIIIYIRYFIKFVFYRRNIMILHCVSAVNNLRVIFLHYFSKISLFLRYIKTYKYITKKNIFFNKYQ